jgi:hypothetical protein
MIAESSWTFEQHFLAALNPLATSQRNGNVSGPG